MSEMMLEIQERLVAGQDIEAIATELQVPLQWVLDAETLLVEDSYNSSYY
jgi:hypothetical protein